MARGRVVGPRRIAQRSGEQFVAALARIKVGMTLRAKAQNAIASIRVYGQNVGINTADSGPVICRVDGPVCAVLRRAVEEAG